MSKKRETGSKDTQNPHETAKDALVTLVLAIRRDLLAQGANPITHWALLESRLKIASRTATRADLFYSALLKLLAIPSASSSVCSAYNRFKAALEVEKDFLNGLHQRVPAVIAEARFASESKRAEAAALRKETEDFHNTHGTHGEEEQS